MKIAQIIHNPGAGDGRHNKETLIALAEESGYKTHYISTKSVFWKKELMQEASINIVAGGDGTVRKLAAVLLNQDFKYRKLPILVLPLGTANNIARSLKIDQLSSEQLITLKKTIDYDCGRISGVDKYDFFIEGMGAGIFPELITKMEEETKEFDSAEDELNHTYEVLKELITSYDPPKLRLKIDETTIEGYFLMAELMNIRFLGPNIELAPHASSDDAFLDLVLIPEKARKDLLNYIEEQQLGVTKHDVIKNIARVYPVKKVSFVDLEEKLHVDDHIVNDPESRVTVSVMPGAFRIFSKI